MAFKNLTDFIDLYTNNGAIFPKEPWGEDIGLEDEGIALIHSLSSHDWLTLRTLNLKQKSNFWVKFLIELLDIAYTEEARQMIIHIALTGTEKNFDDAMERIRDFRRYVDTYTWLKLKNRSSQILSRKLNNQSNNY